jgi:hypothetical protein
MANPPVTLPVINGSTGTWGTILNQAIRDIEGYLNTNATADETQATDIETLKTDVTGLKAKPVGMMAVSTSANRPTAVVGLQGLETDTGYLYYVASILGVPTRVPLPGSLMARLYQSSTQTFATSVGAPLVLHGNDFLRQGGWSSGSRYSAPVSGTYEFTGAISYGNNATGYRAAMWYVGGSPLNGGASQVPAVAAVETTVFARTVAITLTAGQYVELWGAQNSTVSLASSTQGTLRSGIQVKYLGYNGS